MFYNLVWALWANYVVAVAAALALSNTNHFIPAKGVTTSVRTVYEFPQGTWAENLAVRPDGSILISTLQSATLFALDPSSAKPRPLPAATIPQAKSLLGIVEIKPDEYAVVTGNLTAPAGVEPHSFAVWRVALNGHSCSSFGASKHPPTQAHVSLIAALPHARFLNGITLSASNRLLVADSFAGVIWGVNLSNGTSSVAYSDPLLAPRLVNSSSPFGVNGVHTRNGSLFFTNTAQGILARAALGTDGLPTGAASVIARPLANVDHFDDFTLDSSGNVYLTTQEGDRIERLALPQLQSSILAGCHGCLDIVTSTSAAFGRAQGDTHTLYVTTGGAGGGLSPPVNGTIKVGAQVIAISNADS